MQKLIDLVKLHKLGQKTVDSLSNITNENNESQGIIVTIKIDKRVYKIMIPNPYQEAILKEDKLPLINTILQHPEAMQLV